MTGNRQPRNTHTAKTAALWCGTFVVFLILYTATCQRGVDWGDSGLFQLRVQQADFSGQRGLAQAHPLYIALAQVVAWIPVGSLAGRVSFFSGLGMALALANLAVLAARITQRRSAGFLIAAMLGTAHTPWLLSTFAEVYTWSVLGLTIELLLLLRLVDRPSWHTLTLLTLVSGLGFSLHNLALLPLPVYAGVTATLIYRGRMRASALPLAVLAYVAGASPYIWMIMCQARQTGSLGGAVHDALFGRFRSDVLSTGFHWQFLKWNLPFLAMNFLNLLGPLVIVGMVSLRRLGTMAACAIAAITVIEVAFVIRYCRPDMFTFSLPSLLMLAVIAAVGAGALMARSVWLRRLTFVGLVLSPVVQPAAYAAGPWLARAAGLKVSRIRQLPFRDDLRYWLVPWKHNEDSAERFARAALEQAAPDGIIVADATPLLPLEFYQNEHPRFRGVEVLSIGNPQLKSRLASAGGRRIYVVAPGPSYTPHWLLCEAEFFPEGVLHRVSFGKDWDDRF